MNLKHVKRPPGDYFDLPNVKDITIKDPPERRAFYCSTVNYPNQHSKLSTVNSVIIYLACRAQSSGYGVYCQEEFKQYGV